MNKDKHVVDKLDKKYTATQQIKTSEASGNTEAITSAYSYDEWIYWQYEAMGEVVFFNVAHISKYFVSLVVS